MATLVRESPNVCCSPSTFIYIIVDRSNSTAQEIGLRYQKIKKSKSSKRKKKTQNVRALLDETKSVSEKKLTSPSIQSCGTSSSEDSMNIAELFLDTNDR